jgi:putative transposase
MIGLAIHLDQFPAPRFAERSEYFPEPVQHCVRQASLSILGHENEVATKRKSAVKKLAGLVFIHHATILLFMPFANRKITYRLYPNASQAARLAECMGLYCRLHNTLIEVHKETFEATGKGLTFAAMCKEMTGWRSRVPALASLNAQSMQVVAKRVALAYSAFFRRIKAGETPGYPRFKSASRFSGWGYKTYGDGWKLFQPDGQHGKLRLAGIGEISLRGKGRFGGTPKTCEILRKGGKWYASVTYQVAPEQLARTAGTQAAAFDWGLSTLLTLAKADGTLEEIDNPRWLKAKLQAIVALQRTVSAEEIKAKACIGLLPDEPLRKGQRLPISGKMKRLYAQIGRLHGKAARQRHDFYHKLTGRLISQYGHLGTEQLAVANMVRRPRQKENEEGGFEPNGAAHSVCAAGRLRATLAPRRCGKAGLNRSILDAAPSMLLGMLRTKAEEAGSVFAEADTRALKPTQRCHACGTLVRKTLADRRHVCACGEDLGRDENAARGLLRWLLEGNTWFAPGTGASAAKLHSETPSIVTA